MNVFEKDIAIDMGTTSTLVFLQGKGVVMREPTVVAIEKFTGRIDKVGQEFDGVISGLTEWGMYVEIKPEMIEGMVALREIHSDFYEFDEDNYRIVGKRTKKVFRLGDQVRIRVKSANLEQRLLDYELIEIE